MQRRAAREQRLAFNVPARIADHRIEQVLLVQRIGHREADLRIVERFVQHVEAQRILPPGGIEHEQLDVVLVLGEQRQKIMRRSFEQIDLTVDQCIDLCLCVRDPDPLHAIDLRDLATRKT